MKKGLLLVFSLFFITTLSAQNYNIGIRAGLNNSKFRGPSEIGVQENFKLSTGFHFGLSFQWNFTSTFGLRSEVLYTQLGSEYVYDGDGYYIFDYVGTAEIERAVVLDHSHIEIDISNAHLSFPVTAHYKINDKYEVFGGGYINFLVSPVGTGNWLFAANRDTRPDHAFDQAVSFRYNSDVAAANANRAREILLIVNGLDVDLTEPLSAYTLLPATFNSFTTETDETTMIDRIVDTQITTRKFKGVDYGLIIGGNYYLNRGLFVGARIEYGMTDITNTQGDYSFKNVNDDGSLIFNEDDDRNLNIAISFGFKF